MLMVGCTFGFDRDGRWNRGEKGVMFWKGNAVAVEAVGLRGGRSRRKVGMVLGW